MKSVVSELGTFLCQSGYARSCGAYNRSVAILFYSWGQVVAIIPTSWGKQYWSTTTTKRRRQALGIKHAPHEVGKHSASIPPLHTEPLVTSTGQQLKNPASILRYHLSTSWCTLQHYTSFVGFRWLLCPSVRLLQCAVSVRCSWRCLLLPYIL